MDTVFIRGLKAKAVIGVFEWEKQIRQNLVLDLDLRADVAHTAASDTLEEAVDYKAISQRVVEVRGKQRVPIGRVAGRSGGGSCP